MQKVTRGLIRQSDHKGKMRTGIMQIAYTDTQLRVISDERLENRIVRAQHEECNELVSS